MSRFSTISQRIMIVFSLSAICYVLALMVWANIDFLVPHAIFMDEQLTFDGIKKIHASQSVHLLIENIASDDQRYGRVHWYIPALITMPFARYIGDSGILLFTRILSALYLVLGCIVLSRVFIKNRVRRYLCAAVLLYIPFTPYYMTMPKPEPLLVLLLGVFFWLVSSRPGRPKLWAFLVLGVAWGTKISALPFVLFCWCALSVADAVSGNLGPNGESVPAAEEKSGEAVVAGFSPVGLAKNLATYLLAILLGLGIANPGLFYGRVMSYLKIILLSTGHSQDDASINFFAWLDYYIKLFDTPQAFTLFFLGAALVLFVIFSVHFLFVRRKHAFCLSLAALVSDPLFLLFTAAYSFLLPIMLFVKRLWGFYLFIGTILLMVGFIATLERAFLRNAPCAKWLSMAVFAFSAYFIFCQGGFTYWYFARAAGRSASQEHLAKEEEHQQIMSFLESASHDWQVPLQVAYDPHLYILPSRKAVSIDQYWGPFSLWQDGYDIIIMLEEYDPRVVLKNLNKTNLHYDEVAQSAARLEEALSPGCKGICYQRVPFVPERVRIFTRR
ncbi:hypothetical protein [Oceanidesulfovibrio marinus]|uniref:hypothetical protein n=1 Tax=Oceanidesulfovibrio marinus TaxID=370038 RepID=UPI001186D3F3|nr:hypothetical protein [Oceanidesulfovibrio marinus]